MAKQNSAKLFSSWWSGRIEQRGGIGRKEGGWGRKKEWGRRGGEKICLCSLLLCSVCSMWTYKLLDEHEPGSGSMSSPQYCVNSGLFPSVLLSILVDSTHAFTDTARACLIRLLVTSQPHQLNKFPYHTTMQCLHESPVFTDFISKWDHEESVFLCLTYFSYHIVLWFIWCCNHRFFLIYFITE